MLPAQTPGSVIKLVTFQPKTFLSLCAQVVFAQFAVSSHKVNSKTARFPSANPRRKSLGARTQHFVPSSSKNVWKQDVEAIWGESMTTPETDFCSWKKRASNSASESVLHCSRLRHKRWNCCFRSANTPVWRHELLPAEEPETICSEHLTTNIQESLYGKFNGAISCAQLPILTMYEWTIPCMHEKDTQGTLVTAMTMQERFDGTSGSFGLSVSACHCGTVTQDNVSLLSNKNKVSVRPRSHRMRKHICVQICMQIFWCCLQSVWTLPLTAVYSIICMPLLRGALRPVWTGP